MYVAGVPTRPLTVEPVGARRPPRDRPGDRVVAEGVAQRQQAGEPGRIVLLDRGEEPSQPLLHTTTGDDPGEADERPARARSVDRPACRASRRALRRLSVHPPRRHVTACPWSAGGAPRRATSTSPTTAISRTGDRPEVGVRHRAALDHAEALEHEQQTRAATPPGPPRPSPDFACQLLRCADATARSVPSTVGRPRRRRPQPSSMTVTEIRGRLGPLERRRTDGRSRFRPRSALAGSTPGSCGACRSARPPSMRRADRQGVVVTVVLVDRRTGHDGELGGAVGHFDVDEPARASSSRVG